MADLNSPSRLRRTLLAMVAAVPLLGAAGATGQEGAQTQLVVAYVEAPVAGAGAVERSLRAYAGELRKAPTLLSVEVLKEIGRPQRLAVVERWPAAAVPADGAVARLLDGQVQAPVDRRTHKQLGPLLSGGAAPFHMLMHVDVVPAGAEMAAKALDAHRAAVLSARGGLGYEVAVQSDRANHFAVHQTWTSRAAYEAYAADPAAQDLRRQLSTARGGLYDDRFYVSASISGAGR
jgi:quinol monooxygenase YgiN